MANERLKALRDLMEQRGIAVYYVPSSDFHDSEYVAPYFRCRQFLSGFTGSAGTLAVTKDFSGLWTDGRYFVQAKKELEGQDTCLMEMGKEGVMTIEQFIESRLPENGVLGFDGRVVNAALGRRFEALVSKKHGSLAIDGDLAGEIWKERPPLPSPHVWALDIKYAGESAACKLSRLKKAMADKGAQVHLLSGLDDIAWLFNIRKTSEDGNLLAPAHAIISEDTVSLFIDGSLFEPSLMDYFDSINVTMREYGAIYEETAALRGKKILLETGKINFALYRRIDSSNSVIDAMNPTSLMKAVKNPVEMENMRKTHRKDGVALTKFIHWMKTEAKAGDVTETEAAERLEAFRKEQEGYLCPSFDTISAYGENAAMCHYHAVKGAESKVGTDGFYLVDSGGQYYEGTTDVTRTIVMGLVSQEEKLHYTLVLMGMLRLANARFLYGCRGTNLDYLARGPLWQHGLDFNHGTGHGVGYLSNVHERPNGFRWRIVPERQDSCTLEEGMVTSDEPGLYIEGSHGIRTENLLLCKKAEKNEYGQFMCFETLTFAPIDLEAVELSVMEPSDVRLLNEYHKQVYETIAPFLGEEETKWLKEATREIGGDTEWRIRER